MSEDVLVLSSFLTGSLPEMHVLIAAQVRVKQGGTVRWMLIGMGTENDMHRCEPPAAPKSTIQQANAHIDHQDQHKHTRPGLLSCPL